MSLLDRRLAALGVAHGFGLRNDAEPPRLVRPRQVHGLERNVQVGGDHARVAGVGGRAARLRTALPLLDLHTVAQQQHALALLGDDRHGRGEALAVDGEAAGTAALHAAALTTATHSAAAATAATLLSHRFPDPPADAAQLQIRLNTVRAHYNTRRRHTALDMKSPIRYEQIHHAAHAA